MIGVFDSGLGGLVILRELTKRLPDHSFVYFGDNANAPYGTKTPEEVLEHTLEGVRFLFSQGCSMVILACNTASAIALRKIQQEVLPKEFPAKKVLGILVPTVEQVTGLPWSQASGMQTDHPLRIGIFATPGTVKSQAYVHEIVKRRPNARVTQIACPTLATHIETGEWGDALAREVAVYAHELQSSMEVQATWPPDAVLLGCTHYPLIEKYFSQALPGIPIYNQGTITADSLTAYLERHPDVSEPSTKAATVTLFTSGNPATVSQKASLFYGSALVFQAR